jgi:hypothetical protein
MEYQVYPYKNLQNNEPEDKYGVQFEYQDLYQRLLIIKRQRDRQSNEKSFKSFDKDAKRSPSSRQATRNRSGSSLRSQSFVKNQHRVVSTDFKQLLKIYSPSPKQNMITPEKFLSSIKFPNIIQRQKTAKRAIRMNRLKS